MDFEAHMLTKKKEDENECHCTSVEGSCEPTIEKTHVHTVPLEYYQKDIKLLCIQDDATRILRTRMRTSA